MAKRWIADETVFNRSYWAEGTLTGSNNAYTIGWLTDAGTEAGVHSGLNETVNATGLDPVGAIAIMNLGSFRSNSRIITDWNSNNVTFAYDGDGVGWKTKHHAYFLEVSENSSMLMVNGGTTTPTIGCITRPHPVKMPTIWIFE